LASSVSGWCDARRAERQPVRRARPRAGLLVSPCSRCICSVTAAEARRSGCRHGRPLRSYRRLSRVPATSGRGVRVTRAARILRGLADEIDALTPGFGRVLRPLGLL